MNSDSFSRPPLQISRSTAKGVPLESERINDEYSGKNDNRLVMVNESSTEMAEASVSTGWAAENSLR